MGTASSATRKKSAARASFHRKGKSRTSQNTTEKPAEEKKK